MRGLSDQLTATLQQAAGHERLVFLCSFQKEESVILDELLPLAPHVKVVTIDTGVLFPETLQTWKRFEEHFGVHVEVQDAASPDEPAARIGLAAVVNARQRSIGIVALEDLVRQLVQG